MTASTSSAPALLGPSEAGRLLGVSASTIVRWAKSGKLPSIETSLGRVIPREAVDELRGIRVWVNG